MIEEGLDLYPGALAGYRAFKLFCGRLYSLTKNHHNTHYEYSLEENEASCPYGHARAPQGDCSCGFWMYKDLDGVLDEPLAYPDQRARSQLVDVPTVLMLVAGWGKVTEDEVGFRTEYVKPLAVIEAEAEVPDDIWGRHHYFQPHDIGLPTTDREDLPALVEDFGLMVLEREEAAFEPQSITNLHIASNAIVPPPVPPQPYPLSAAVLWPPSSYPAHTAVSNAWNELLKSIAEWADAWMPKLLLHKNETRCCENNEEHERSGKWCRRVFSTFFIAVEDGGRLSFGEYLESIERGVNRRPVLPGYMRMKGRG